ncbi:MAG: winged helix-turn-helix transcriptional regulator [Candidatus Bathyarchaeia archaeon]
MLDELDLKILKHICEGLYSYDDLAKRCGASRNTIYRRISKLENMGIIKKRITAIPDFSKIGFSAVIIGINLNPKDIDRAISFLKTQHQVKFLWRTYGQHDIIAAILCDKDDVGTCIYNIRKALEEQGIHVIRLDISVSVMWEKMHIVP